tara:strand:+ start:2264 stop:3529 length:1266 start_codon:yes stop_codon:yes gene_type:complete
MNIGEYELKFNCRLCNSNNLKEIIDFGNMPLAGGFLEKSAIEDEKIFPLTIDFCKECNLVQVRQVISVDILFKEKYFFFSSAINTLVQHFELFSREIYKNYLNDSDSPLVLEIGCNDGVLLKPLASLGVKTIGVDPAKNVVEKIDSNSIDIYNECFTETLSNQICNKYGKVDLVISCYSFAHIDNMIDVVKGIKNILKDDGIFIFEIYCLGTLIDEMQYDNIYHEHMSYYTIKTLEYFFSNFNMEIFDLKYFPKVRTGSTRFYIRNSGQRGEEISYSFLEMKEYELNKGFNRQSVLTKYADDIKKSKLELLNLLTKLKNNGNTIIGYGASGRGTMISNYCNIDNRFLEYIIDDAPEKHGFFTPGTHLEIKPWTFINNENYPDYILLFAWAFADEVMQKRRDFLERGGKFIIPLPEVKIISV